MSSQQTRKNSLVDPDSSVPYLISVCLARSSADSIGDCIRSAVRKAARLAVYEEMRISVKNHHTLPTILPDIDLSGNTNKLMKKTLATVSCERIKPMRFFCCPSIFKKALALSPTFIAQSMTFNVCACTVVTQCNPG